MGKLDPGKFADWLEAQYRAGCGYMMGAVGQHCDGLTKGSWLVAQYKDNAKQYAQALKWLESAPRVFDCQGLADCYITEQTGVKTNVYARTNYAQWCGVKGTGKIPGEMRVRGAAVFTYSAAEGRITHVGFLIEPVKANEPYGDWHVIEARGVMYGVVKTKLFSRSWNRWGLMDEYFNYGISDDAPPMELGKRLLKKGMKGDDVKILQECLMKVGYDLPKYGADGDYGDETMKTVKAFQRVMRLEVDGIYGEKTHGALMAELTDFDEEHGGTPTEKKTVAIAVPGTWNVRLGAGTEHGIVTVVRSGAVFPYVSVAPNGWVQIEINGGYGWVSPKCAEVV